MINEIFKLLCKITCYLFATVMISFVFAMKNFSQTGEYHFLHAFAQSQTILIGLLLLWKFIKWFRSRG